MAYDEDDCGMDYFQREAKPQKTPLDSKSISFWANGLGGEVAEFAEVTMNLLNLMVAAGNISNFAKKFERDQPALKEQQDAIDQRIKGEAGNVMFYLAQVLKKRGIDMSEAAYTELDKLDAMAKGEG